MTTFMRTAVWTQDLPSLAGTRPGGARACLPLGPHASKLLRLSALASLSLWGNPPDEDGWEVLLSGSAAHGGSPIPASLTVRAAPPEI